MTSITVKRDLVYDATKNLQYDLFIPSNVDIKHTPILFVIHGGAWMIGKKEALHDVALEMCKHLNVLVALPDYSLSQIDVKIPSIVMTIIAVCVIEFAVLLISNEIRDRGLVTILIVFLFLVLLTLMVMLSLHMCQHRKENNHPVHVKDIACCIQRVCENLESCDSTPILLLGHSAGAHIASLVSLNAEYLQTCYLNRIRGVVAISGVYSFWRMQDSFTKYFLNQYVFRDMFSEYLSHADLELMKTTNIEMYNYICSAWPIFHADKSKIHKPFFLIVTSDIDFALLQHATDFTNILKHNLFKVQHVHFPATTHFNIRKLWTSKNKHISSSIQHFLQLCLNR